MNVRSAAMILCMAHARAGQYITAPEKDYLGNVGRAEND